MNSIKKSKSAIVNKVSLALMVLVVEPLPEMEVEAD